MASKRRKFELSTCLKGKFMCPICHALSSKKYNIERHIKTVHADLEKAHLSVIPIQDDTYIEDDSSSVSPSASTNYLTPEFHDVGVDTDDNDTGIETPDNHDNAEAFRNIMPERPETKGIYHLIIFIVFF